jgi:hypothetical protein
MAVCSQAESFQRIALELEGSLVGGVKLLYRDLVTTELSKLVKNPRYKMS